MPPEIDPHLEALVDEELRQLPPVAAPTTLAPRILAAIQARAAQPWWRRSWWNWPPTAQAAFLLLALAIVSLLAGGSWWLGEDLNAYSQQAAQKLSLLSAFWQSLQALATAVVLLWQKTAQALLVYALVASLVLYLVCLGLGTVFVRFAWRRC